MEYKRAQYETLFNRLGEKRNFLQVVAGPRQVGKTTLIRQVLTALGKPHRYATADTAGSPNAVWISQQWQAARLAMRATPKEDYILVIDEVQKIGQWSTAVKAEWDRDTSTGRRLKVVLSGSSQLLLQRGLTESLTGRFELIYLSHWSLSEMQAAFTYTPAQFVWFGGYPGAAPLIDDEARWTDYIRNAFIETTIAKDILMLNEVRKPALLRQLFELGCIYSGQILSYTKMLGQLTDAGNTTTLSHYLTLLSSAGMLTGISAYSKAVVKTRASSPRLNVLNTAFLPPFTSATFATVRDQPALWGRHVESAVGAHLLNTTHYTDIQVCYWRSGNYEVDYVLERQGETVAIEVKSGRTLRNKGLAAFQKKFAPRSVLLVGGDGLSWEEFLLLDPADLFL